MKFTILHTNDIHSRFENFAKISTKIKQLRDENTLILDAGDFNDFMRIELQGTDGRAGTKLLSISNYDAIAVGNNETFEGLDILSNMALEGKVPFLACNLYKLDLTPIEGIRKSIIVDKSGIKFLIIGASPELHEFFKLYNIRTIDYKQAIKKEIDNNKGKYDICILLSHLGIWKDIDIAETVDGIDIIIGGHTHTLMNKPEMVKNTIIHHSGCYGEYLGVIELNYSNGIKFFSGENVKVTDLGQNIEILDSIRESKEVAIDRLSKPLYYIQYNLWHDVMEENPITNLLADALKDLYKCDIGLVNSGVLSGGIKKGPVSLKKLLEICPSPLNPTLMEIQGRSIKKALEQSMYTDFCTQDGGGAGFRGRFLGKLHISGGIIEHDGRHIRSIYINGRKLEDEKWYTVGTSDYLQRGTGYTSLANNRNPKYNHEYLRTILKDYICKDEYIKEAFIERWVEKL